MEKKAYIRQPIVAVLGHVDHGKTTLLDYIRHSTVAAREAGAITQHIGATEVPIEVISQVCGNLLNNKKFTIPGLLFIDTPGHHAFTTLRARGGALADIAILVVDIKDGIMPQSVETLKILRRFRTPFIVAANKIDDIPGWQTHQGSFTQRLKSQGKKTQDIFEKHLYDVIGDLFTHGFKTDRYDRVTDFKKNVAIIPISAKTGEGIPELLMIVIGLAQRFLEKRLSIERGPAEGTVLEVKEERGLGATIDVIIYNGIIQSGDDIIVGGKQQPVVTRVRALLKPKPLDEIRDPSEKFDNIDELGAAAGVKIAAPGLEHVFAGATLRVADDNVEETLGRLREDLKVDIKLADEGVILKGDAIGSLEGLASELGDIPIRKAEVGDVSHRDVVEAQTNAHPLHRVLLGFNVKISPEILEEAHTGGVKVITDKIVYHIVQEYQEWRNTKKRELEEEQREDIIHPGMALFLPNCTFRVSKPAVIGVRILAGEIRTGEKLIRDDGKRVGEIKSIQSEKETLSRAIQGQEVAIAIENITVGRHIKPEQILFVDLPEKMARKLLNHDLTSDERDVLDKLVKIKRQENKLWGL